MIQLPEERDRLYAKIHSAYERDFQDARSRSVLSIRSDEPTNSKAKSRSNSKLERSLPSKSVFRGARLERSQSNSEWLSSNWKGKALDDMVRRGIGHSI